MAARSGDSATVLYKYPEAWGLPSSSVACIQAEIFFRLSGLSYETESCTSTSKSPTGCLPAAEHDADISAEPASDEFSHATHVDAVHDYTAAKHVMAFAQRHGGAALDDQLTTAQKAELLAFSTLVESRLDLATSYSTWCESTGFAEFRKVSAACLPFPLNYVIPWSQRRDAKQRFAHLAADQVYGRAAQVINAVSDRLRSSGGRYFFGARPSSLDALLAGHLVYYRLSPAAAPVLKDKVNNQPSLCEYLDYIMQVCFSAGPAPTRQLHEPGTSSESAWSDAAKGQKSKPTKPAEPTAAEKEFRRNSKFWLIGAGAAIVAYILLSGQYVEIAKLQDYVGTDGDDDGDEGDDE